MIWTRAVFFDPKNYCTDPTHLPEGPPEGPFGAHEHIAMPDQVDGHLIAGIRRFDPEAIVYITPLPLGRAPRRHAAL